MANHRKVVVVLLLVLGGLSAVAISSPRAAVAAGCPRYEIIGSRGSGTKAGTKQWGDGLGLPGQAFATAFKTVFAGDDVAVVHNPYPAVGILPSLKDIAEALGTGIFGLPARWRVVQDTLNGVGALARSKRLGAYAASVKVGEADLKSMITKAENACSATTQLILVGYSQGAQVTGDVLQTLPRSEKSDIAEVVLFGDSALQPERRVRSVRLERAPEAAVDSQPGDPVPPSSLQQRPGALLLSPERSGLPRPRTDLARVGPARQLPEFR